MSIQNSSYSNYFFRTRVSSDFLALPDNSVNENKNTAPITKKNNEQDLQRVFWSAVRQVKNEVLSGSKSRKWNLKVENAANALLDEETNEVFNKAYKAMNKVKLASILRKKANGG